MKAAILFGPALIAALLVGTIARAEDVTKQRSVAVTGSCVKSMSPDRGSIVLTAESQQNDLATAAKKATEIYEDMKQAVQKLKLKDVELQTTEYNFQEVREWQKDRQVFKGFKARMGLQVSTSEINRLGEVIALAAKHGVRDVGALATYLSEEKEKAGRQACLEDAIRNARAKAEIIVKAAGARLGRVLTVNETPLVSEPPRPMARMEMSFAGAAKADVAPPGVETAAQKLIVDVAVTFAIE